MNRDYDADLYRFFTGFFNQDWVEIGDWIGSPSTASVAAFIRKTFNAAAVCSYRDDLIWLLSQGLSEKALAKRVLDDYGSSYNPAVYAGFGERYDSTALWLQHFVDLLS